MSIFQTLFSGISGGNSAPPAAPAQNSQQQGQQQGQQPAPQSTQNPAFPSQQQQTNGATTDQQQQAPNDNPLDAYKDIFNPVQTDPAKQPEASTAVVFNQQEVQQKLQGMDFMKFVNPQDLQALQQGGEGAVTAMGNMMNAMMRQAMLMQTAFAANTANRAAEFAMSKTSSAVPELVRGQLTQQEFADPSMNHPALQPMIKALTNQFQNQFPKASPQEVANHVKTYLGTIGQVFSPESKGANNSQTNGQNTQSNSQDWSTFFSGTGGF